MLDSEKWDSKGKIVALAAFVGLVVDGMDLQMLALSLPKIMREMNISSVLGGALATYTFVGMGIGGIFAGWLADRLGRVRVIFWSILTFSIFTSGIALSKEFWQIAAMRFISGFGLGAVYGLGNLLAAEYAPTRIRTTVGGTMQAGWSVGYVLAALLSSYILPNFGWRFLFAIAIIPGALALWLLRNVSDPPSWLAARQAAIMAGKRENEFIKIWSDKKIRLTLALWIITSISLQFGYYGAVSWLPSYLVKDLGVNLQKMGWYIAATYCAMIIGKLITGYLADSLGRRALWVFCGLSTAVALPVIMKYATPNSVAYLLLIFGLFYGAPWAINSTYMNESYPTVIRGTAMSLSHNSGRIGAAISPLVIGLVASQYSISAGIALLGITYFIAALIPGIWIAEKMYDPKIGEVKSEAAIRVPAVKPAGHGIGIDKRG